MFDYKKFSSCIKSKRKEINYTVETLADKIGIGYKHLGNIERGQAKPSIETVIKLLNVFNSSLDEYLDIKLSKRDTKINEILANVKSFDLNENQKAFILAMGEIIKKGSHDDGD